MAPNKGLNKGKYGLSSIVEKAQNSRQSQVGLLARRYMQG